MEKRKIGEILVDKGILQPYELTHALELQKRDNSILGKILIGESYVKNKQLYEAVAERFGLEFVDLIKNPPQRELLDADLRHEYFALEVLPYSQDSSSITLAVTHINSQIRNWAIENYPETEIKFVITSPYDIRHVLQQEFSSHHDEDARLKLWKTSPVYSAQRLFNTFRPNIILATALMVMVASFFSEKSFISLILFMNALFFCAMSFKNFVFLTGCGKKPKQYSDVKNYPVYTILLPLYHETSTLPKLINAIQKLDYPKSKLDVKFVVEADDMMTLNAIKQAHPPQYMEIISVPFSLPRTKPKACNYALNFARGEYITIYDAEDLPDPQQLKKSLAKFQSSDEKLACIQARLNYYNYNDNQLTRWFALEYAMWFDSIITGLETMKMPLPLGGTSNHVKTSVLREIGGWDAFNVTEDADLGMRLAQEGYRTETIDSLTLEEAPNRLRSWIKQRTRWIKGFMQTYFVHMRNIGKLYKTTGLRGFLSLQFFMGIPVMLYLTAPFLAIASVIMTSGIHPMVTFPSWLNTFCWFNLFYGIASHIIMCLVSARKARRTNGDKMFKHSLIFTSLIFYLYGIFHVMAAFRALYQLITAPHYWDKTQHGLAKTGA